MTLHISLVILMLCIILLRRTGNSDTRLAWIVFVVLAPFVGALAYLFFGGQRIGGRRRRRHHDIHSKLFHMRTDDVRSLQASVANIPEPWARTLM